MPKNQPKKVEKKPDANQPEKVASNLTEVFTFINFLMKTNELSFYFLKNR